MKKRINLFSQRILPRKIVDYYIVAKRYAYIFMGYIFLTYAILYLISFFIEQRKKEVENNALVFENYVSQNRKLSFDLEKFTFKYEILKSHQSNDLEGYKYLNSLQETFSIINIPVILKSFTLNSERETTFSIEFSNYDAAISFLELLETADFQKLFKNLKLDSFNLTEQDQSEFTLTFSGIFLNILNNEDK